MFPFPSCADHAPWTSSFLNEIYFPLSKKKKKRKKKKPPHTLILLKFWLMQLWGRIQCCAVFTYSDTFNMESDFSHKCEPYSVYIIWSPVNITATCTMLCDVVLKSSTILNDFIVFSLPEWKCMCVIDIFDDLLATNVSAVSVT